MFHSSYPQATVHLDADAFFASVEQATHPEWQGKPLVTGAERGMVIALSYQAKELGIKTITEYVHSQSVLECVKEIGLDCAQGFYIGKPAPELGASKTSEFSPKRVHVL